jgi:ATP-dependent DNA ligase
VEAGGSPPAGEGFPELDLPVRPFYPPMEATAVREIPTGDGWLYEPKWDGFRCLAFRGAQVVLQSKSGQPLARYFPEVVEALAALPAGRFVLDGEIVVFADGRVDFDALLQRIHPAASRVRRLAAETPATYLVFDLLVDGDGAYTSEPLARRRERLEAFFARLPADGLARLSPATRERELAERWMRELGGGGLDGVVAKRLEAPYRSGERTAMQKVKRLRTADCVVGGFRYASSGSRQIGSLLLGLYDDEGRLNHVGFAASFTVDERRALAAVVEPHIGPPGFTGDAPGGPSRWSTERSSEWQPLDATLVCEVRYDHFSGGRFRHGTKFLRWRPDKAPAQCTYAQVEPPGQAAVPPSPTRKAG